MSRSSKKLVSTIDFAPCCLTTQSGTIDIRGHLRFKSKENIKLGAWVRWGSDHLVFYENDRNSRDYTAYVRLS